MVVKKKRGQHAQQADWVGGVCPEEVPIQTRGNPLLTEKTEPVEKMQRPPRRVLKALRAMPGHTLDEILKSVLQEIFAEIEK